MADDAIEMMERGELSETSQMPATTGSSTHGSNVPSHVHGFSPQRSATFDIRPMESVANLVHSLKSYPPGYPRTACFLDSDPAFMMYRRFGTVSARLLLNKQDELRKMEQLLNEMDHQSTKTLEGRPLRSREVDVHENFGHLLAHAKQNVAMSKPTKSEYTSVRNFFHNSKPLVESEMEWIENQDDLVTLRPGRPPSSLEDFFEWTISKLGFRRLKDRSPQFQHSRIKPNRYYKQDMIKRVVTAILILTMLSFINMPIWLLAYTSHPAHPGPVIALFAGSTLLFSTMLNFFTKAKRHELLAATACYTAILVVFMGNLYSTDEWGVNTLGGPD